MALVISGTISTKTMTSDLDIYRSAQVLIREHGDGAEFEAAR